MNSIESFFGTMHPLPEATVASDIVEAPTPASPGPPWMPDGSTATFDAIVKEVKIRERGLAFEVLEDYEKG